MAARIPEPDAGPGAPVAGLERSRRAVPAGRDESPAPRALSVHDDLVRARVTLREAEEADDPARRYQLAHLGALRTAAVLLATRSRRTRGHAPVDVWALLGRVAPEYGEWAAFFSANHPRWQLIGTGARGGVVSGREADDLVRDAWRFHDLVAARFVPLPAAPSRPPAVPPHRDPAGPARPVGPGEPAGPVRPVGPPEPVRPGRPGEPAEPVRPAGTTDPVPARSGGRGEPVPVRPGMPAGSDRMADTVEHTPPDRRVAVVRLLPSPVGAGEG